MISQGRNAVVSVWWRPHLKRTTGDLHLNFLFSLSTWTAVHLKFPLYQYQCEKLVINNFHIINIHMKSCSIKISTLFISMSKVVHLGFPLYQHPHTKLFIKNFHIIDIHKKSCSLKNFHFIKTHKQFFSFPLYQYPPKSCCNNLAPLSPHKFSLIMSLT